MNPAAAIWKERLSAHLRIVARYTIYAGRSGLFMFMMIVFIASSYMYGKALIQLPETFPYMLVITCWLTPFIALSPIRTLLREADLVFLLPMEAKMGVYFRNALLYSFAMQAFAVLFALSAAMPLYRHGAGDGALPLLGLALLALALKFANLLGSWMENSFVRSGYRTLFRFARWIGSFGIVYALYRYGWIAGIGSFAASFAIMGGWAAASRRLKVNWPYLRLVEAGHRTNLLLFFHMFIDVDELPNRVKPRRALSRLAARVPFRSSEAFRYLYWLTLLRSELFGIVLRLSLVALAILLAVEGPLLFAAVYVLFQVVTGVQLGSLHQFHRHSVWPALYPLPAALRQKSAVRVSFAVQLALALVLALPLCRPAVFTPWLLALPLIGIAIAFAFRRGAAKRSA
ncbi:ABC transporter permease [Paenibacillus hodogayensis]|uniref:ABC transporter permease n=1 Tax=Paenibacillus hodogayensis TaxID=279208 RepID=A0ABV5W5P2_9BACL